MRRIGAVIGAALAILGAVAFSHPAEASAVRHSPARLLRANAEYTWNWSGYVVQGKPISEVRGSWHVPAMKLAPPGFSSSWIGIGGWSTGDLIQVGTATSHVDGHYAWYEMLPDFAIPLEGCAGDAACRVATNDRMSASVVNTGGDNWTLMMANLGKGPTAKWHWAKTVTYKSTLSSAEWIFEAPMVGGVQTIPGNVHPAKFVGGTYKLNGTTLPLRAGAATRVIMVPPCVRIGNLGCNVHTATPSLLAGDGHFQVCAYKPKCPNY